MGGGGERGIGLAAARCRRAERLRARPRPWARQVGKQGAEPAREVGGGARGDLLALRRVVSEPEARRPSAPEACSPPSPAWSRPPASSSAPSPARAEPSPSRPRRRRGFAEAAADLGDRAGGLLQSRSEAGRARRPAEPPGSQFGRRGSAAGGRRRRSRRGRSPHRRRLCAAMRRWVVGRNARPRARGERPVLGGEGEDEGSLPAGPDRGG